MNLMGNLKAIPYYLAVLSTIYGNAELCRYIIRYMDFQNIPMLSVFGLELALTGYGIVYFMAKGITLLMRKEET